MKLLLGESYIYGEKPKKKLLVVKVNNYFPALVSHKSPSSVIVSAFYFVIAYMLKEILSWITCSWKEILEGSKLSLC